MKQSKKLLSIFLAMLMLLGTVSVIASAGQVKVEENNISYDSMDNPVISADQAAYIVLNVLDDLLGEANIDFSVDLGLTEITLNLTSVDNAFKTFKTVDSLKGLVGGDVSKLNLNAVKKGQTRSKTGDLQILLDLLQFLGDNAATLSKVAYGLGTDKGLSLGLIGSFIDLGDINNILGDLPGFLVKTCYDLLIHGSYSADGSFDKNAEEHGGKVSNLPESVRTLDGIVNTAVRGLLVNPQQYTYNDAGEKVWDMESRILGAKGENLDLDLTTNSVFDIIDEVLQVAYENFGATVLNHDVKKIFMEAMGVDFVVLDPVKDAEEIKTIKADSDYVNVEDKNVDASSVKNYFCNAQMWEVDGTWYFRDYVTRDVLDANGNPVMENGEVKTAKQHRYQRAESYNADSLYALFKWDYNLTATTLNFNDMIKKYGSLIGSLNHILYVIFDNAINFDALGIKLTDIWTDGGNDNINENLVKTAKYLLTNFTFMFFGRNPEYVNLNTLQAKPEFVEKINEFGTDDKGREGLIAYMLLPFLGDALPQLVYDVNMFHEGVQIEETAVLLVREFLSDLTPQINYDDQIFTEGSLTSATGRQFQNKTSAQWIELLLNMGLDLAAVYLDNITNFNVNLENLAKIKGYAVAKGQPAYMGVLEEIVDWAVSYIGSGKLGLLNGLSPNELGSVRCITGYDHTTDTATIADNHGKNAFDILSKALNTILPLGMFVGLSSDTYALDVSKVFDLLINVIDDVDIEALIGIFGRNGRTDNILGQKNVIAQILGLVNKIITIVIGKGLFEEKYMTSLASATSQASLQAVVNNLIGGLSNRREPILKCALPVVAVFVDDWCSEQAFRSLKLDIDDTYELNSGSRSDMTFTIKNNARGLWRGYMSGNSRAHDQQYVVNVSDISAYNYDGTPSSYVEITSKPTGKYNAKDEKSVVFKASNVPATGAIVRFDVTYTMTNGITTDNLPSTYVASEFVWLFHGEDRFSNVQTSKQQTNYALTPLYANVDDIGSISDVRTAQLYRKNDGGKDKQPAKIIVTSGNATQGGITYNNLETDLGKGDTQHHYKLTADPAAFAESGLKAGDKLSWQVQITSYEDKSGNKPVELILYSGNDLNALRDVVNHEASLMRLPGEYNTSSKEWADYTAAFQAAFGVARTNWNIANSTYADKINFAKLASDLKAASKAVDKVKVETAKDKAIDNIEGVAKQMAKDLNGKDYRTYMLYRWNRYYDVYKSANNFVALKDRVALGVETQNFNYSGLTANEVTELLKISGNGTYADYVKATFTPMTEEEVLEAERNYNNASRDLAETTIADIENAQSLLPVLKNRLLPREGGVVKTYLETEIASASTLKEADYTAMSWAVFKNALDAANTAKSSDSQDTIFKAKYALQVARNGLVLKGDEADYTELKAVIAQANAALTNASSYENGAADFGAVLAALGYEVKDANGNTINLYPGSAIDVEDIPYGTHDQDEIDDAADELKRALAKLKFKNLNTGSVGVENKEFGTGEFDETTNTEIKESVLVKNVAKEQKATDVAALVKALGDDVTVSLDETYSASVDTDLFVGTGSTITVFKKQGDVKVPVATIKVVVNGDVNGDGVIDVLDCSSVELASHGLVVYNGVYGLAADVATGADGNITIDDVQAVVGLAKAS